ncbi:MAG: hypothetical protein HY746_09290 [Elusimicrobia bacterium]|nr:hypothetical protein [Elusimicrobiota bacterium]
MKTIIITAILLNFFLPASASDIESLKNIEFSNGFSVTIQNEYVPQPHEMLIEETKASDPGRTLTQGETAILTEIFGSGVDDSRVRIHNRKYAFFQPSQTVMAPNGNIYYPPGHPWYSHDYSLSYHAGSRRGNFIHEMTHVYQHQQGVSVINRRLEEGGIYDYRIEPGKDLNDYTVEQQADIVKDYAYCRSSYADDPSRCSGRFSPALDNFIKNPNYLRKAEQERLERLNAQTTGTTYQP